MASTEGRTFAGFDHLLHGGDYNPEQWMDEPGIWEQDMRLMKLAHCNTFSVGIFSWVSLEPQEGRFEFDWLDRILDRLAENGMRVILATPSGAKPPWMSLKYPEICRVAPNGLRESHVGRHNHCPTSPVYREKVRIINTRLAERYKDHPAPLLWHLSNEYGGYCYCDLCMAAFRRWLQARYGTLEALNHAWWTRFWSHSFNDWNEIQAVDGAVHGMQLDWRRFMTDQVIDFMRHEMAPLQEHTPQRPVTTNFMGTYDAYNYWKMARHLDVVCWDNYPDWHGEGTDWQVGRSVAFVHDIYRAMKGGQPWLLMESTPSVTNWRPVSVPKRPGMHRLSSLQAVAHGSDSVLYFQWRKSRGSAEKFHGAVVDHAGHEHTRVFEDVAEVGRQLEKLTALAGTRTPAQVALIYDWENRWAIEQANGPRNRDKDYQPTCEQHYEPFWKRAVAVDVIDMETDLAPYRLVVAPMLYMLRPGVAERIRAFVENGGTLVATYLTGIADESDLCFLGGFPGPLRPVLGVWAEETDALPDHALQSVVPVSGNSLGLSGTYRARHYCDVIHSEGAEVLATYGHEFYAGQPALTVNRCGAGSAYYVASRNEERFTDDLLGGLTRQLGLRRAVEVDLPEGISVQTRTDGEREFLFIMNFQSQPQRLDIPGLHGRDLLRSSPVTDGLELEAYGVAVVEQPLRRFSGKVT